MTWKRWNHRRDRQVLLAIFAQTNMKVPNFKELSEILGGEEYSVDMLRYVSPEFVPAVGLPAHR